MVSDGNDAERGGDRAACFIPRKGGGMSPDEELWGAASMILRIHGDKARLHVVERLGTLALEADWDGVAVWQGIAARMEALIQNEGERH